MVAEIEEDQFTLFPVCSQNDKIQTKSSLENYVKMKLIVVDFEKHTNTTHSDIQIKRYNHCRIETDTLLRALNLIIDPELREIMEYRYIDGNSNKQTILRFKGMTERTVDRKLNEGITSIANSIIMLKG